MKVKQYVMAIFLLLAMGIGGLSAKRVYVKPGGTGNKSGDDWNNTKDLADALKDAQSNDEIWVAKGTYMPKYSAEDGKNFSTDPSLARTRAFLLVDGVSLYGGFAGDEAVRSARNPKVNKTTLSGDLSGNDDNYDGTDKTKLLKIGNLDTKRAENVRHVIVGAGITTKTVVDGFTIEGGQAVPPAGITNKSRPLGGKIIYDEWGGGAVLEGCENVEINNCIFRNNYSSLIGGAICARGGSFVMKNTKFIRNVAGSWGGALYLHDSKNYKFVNCLFSANSVGLLGSVMTLEKDVTLTLVNSTIANNYLKPTADNNNESQGLFNTRNSGNVYNIYNSIILQEKNDTGNTFVDETNTSTRNISNSMVTGVGANTSLGNIKADVTGLFVANKLSGELDAGRDYRLKAGSKAINKGDNGKLVSGGYTDLDGRGRVVGEDVDLGAYEYKSTSLTPTNKRLYVKPGGTGKGSSWADAVDLADALVYAKLNEIDDVVDEIWVARGTYKPKYSPADGKYLKANLDDSRENSFLLADGVNLYGGFAGNEILRSARNPKVNKTILSGDIKGDDGNVNLTSPTAAPTEMAENAYHVVVGAKLAQGVTIDGFTIERGNANNSSYLKISQASLFNKIGGGINVLSSRGISIKNCMIRNNYALVYSGAAYFETTSGIAIHNTLFSHNKSERYVGGLYFRSKFSQSIESNLVANCLFTGNSSEYTDRGQSFRLFQANETTVLNSTFSGNGNKAGDFDIDNYSTLLNIYNSIVLTEGNTVSISGGGTMVENSIVPGWSGGTNNITTADATSVFVDPKGFNSTDLGDYRLKATGAAVDAGNNARLLSSQITDIEGKVRVAGQAVDLGAYEYTAFLTPTNKRLYVKPGGTGKGSSWADAVDLADALVYAKLNEVVDLVDEIWVARGTYKPKYNPEDGKYFEAINDARENSFLLVDGVNLYGGFAGDEATLIERNLKENKTILSGDFKGNDGNVNLTSPTAAPTGMAENAYHVVVGAKLTKGVTIDGFTIERGNANNTRIYDISNLKFNSKYGGGINVLSSRGISIKNCMIRNNYASSYGGAAYFSATSGIAIHNTLFSHNKSEEYVGGLYIRLKSSQSIESNLVANCLFTGNSSKYTDRGQSFRSFQANETTVLNSTFSGNGNKTGNFDIDNYSTLLNIYNSIVLTEGNTVSISSGGVNPVTVENSIVPGWSGGTNNITTADATSVFVDPKGFNSPDLGDYRLKATGAAVDAGNNARLLSSQTTDIEGKGRVAKQKVDLGAYEYTAFLMPTNKRLYVKPGGTGKGSSWADAVDLADALVYAKVNEIDDVVDEIWVAAGTYKPKYNPEDGKYFEAINDARENSFLLVDGVNLYGGFAGTETKLIERNLKENKTILSGDFKGDDGDANLINNSAAYKANENAYNVVIGAKITKGVTIDGFTIERGNANNSRVYGISNLVFRSRYGGGIYVQNSRGISIKNCMIRNNYASSYGGAAYFSATSGITIHNTLFSHNKSEKYVGGLYIRLKSSQSTESNLVANCLFTGNSSEYTSRGQSFGLYEANETTVLNSTFSGNGNKAGDFDIYNDNTPLNIYNSIVLTEDNTVSISSDGTNTVTVENSIVPGWSGGANNITTADATNIFVDPKGSNSADLGDYRLKAGSKAINRGDNGKLVSGEYTDIEGRSRVVGDNIDLGAYEYTAFLTPKDKRLYVKPGGTGKKDGSSWADAVDLADAMVYVKLNEIDDIVDEIWVAAGTYKPKYSPTDGKYLKANPNDARDKSFLLADGVKLYGGFAGEETMRRARNPKVNKTILSGDFNGDDGDANLTNNSAADKATENAYHVLVGANITKGVTIDGFTIERGNGNIGGWYETSGLNVYHDLGGAIYLTGSSNIVVENCTIRNNFGVNFGGGIYAERVASITCMNTVFAHNRAGVSGGGVYIRYKLKSIGLINLFLNCLFTGSNGGNNNGTALRLEDTHTTTVINSTFSGNGDADKDTAIHLKNTTGNIYNSIVLTDGNTSSISKEGTNMVRVKNSIVPGWSGGTGNITTADATSVFVAPKGSDSSEMGDYRLKPGSVAIGAGNNASYEQSYGLEDLSGSRRIVHKNIDLGAYEKALELNPTSGRLYVNVIAEGSSEGDGSSWSESVDLSTALLYAHDNPSSVSEIWVAKGTYTPKYSAEDGQNFSPTPEDSRTKAFLLVNGVSLYGGFAGSETEKSQRNPSANETILSGDLLGNDDYSQLLGTENREGNRVENVRHIIVGAGITAKTVVDGFTVEGGQAVPPNGIKSLARLLGGIGIYDEWGGGAALEYCENVEINNCIFRNNYSSLIGGAICARGGSFVIKNTKFIRNVAASWGGALYLHNSRGYKFVNCLFTANFADLKGAVMTLEKNVTITLVNSTIANNYLKPIADNNNESQGLFNTRTSGNIYNIYNNIILQEKIKDETTDKTVDTGVTFVDETSTSTRNISNSMVTGVESNTSVGNLNATVTNIFIGSKSYKEADASRDYRLKAGTSAIGAGNNDKYISETGESKESSKDLAGQSRFLAGKIDLGAYETLNYIKPEEGTKRVYVTEEGAGSKDGSSWENAAAGLADVLRHAQLNKDENGGNLIDEIWVAKGTYVPKYSPVDGDNFTSNPTEANVKSFLLVDGISLYGGFAGTEVALSERNLKGNETVLSGALDESTKVYHTVVGANMATVADFDGFLVSGGYADGGPTQTKIGGIPLFRDWSGGMVLGEVKNLTIKNCVFKDNEASSVGAGLGLQDCDNIKVIASEFRNNKAYQNTFGGGAVFSRKSTGFTGNVNSEFVNCLFTNNYAKFKGGAIHLEGGKLSLVNCTLAKHSAGDNSTIYNDGGSLKIYNSIVLGSGTGISKNGTTAEDIEYSLVVGWPFNEGDTNLNPANIIAEDVFVAPEDPTSSKLGDYRLKVGSVAINAGDNSYYNSSTYGNKDLAGVNRVIKGFIDLGAYEIDQFLNPVNGLLYVREGGHGKQDGSSWQDAADLSDALLYAQLSEKGKVTDIWVAKGTYQPVYSPADGKDFTPNPDDFREKSFLLVDGVNLYGGFAGTEISVSGRDIAANPTILSGSRSSYHVVIAGNFSQFTLFDGFIVTKGQADKNKDMFVGGTRINAQNGAGMFISSGGMLKVRNTTISSNTSVGNGAGVYIDTSAQFAFETTFFIGNKTEGNGAGLAVSGLSQGDASNINTLVNTVFTGNESLGSGAGIYSDKGAQTYVYNSTFSSNLNGTQGDVFSSGTVKFGIYNSILFGSENGGIGGDIAPSFIEYSLIDGLNEGNNINPDGLSSSDIFTNPLAAGLSSGGDYSLKPGSSVIDKGSNSLYVGGDINGKDVVGNPRLEGASIDLGAYERTAKLVQELRVSNVSKVYGAEPFIPVVVSDSGLTEFTYTSEDENIAKVIDGAIHIVGAGTVTIIVNQSGDDVYKPANPTPFKLAVQKADIENISLDGLTHIYDGTAQSILLKGSLPSGATVAYTGNEQKEVGDYKVTATISGGVNYNDKVITADLIISKATITGVYFSEDADFYYDGEQKVFELSGTLPEGTEVEYFQNKQTLVGVYDVLATVTGGRNYSDLVVRGSFEIKKTLLPADLELLAATYTYDGKVKSLELQGNLPAGVSVSYENNDQVNAGTYEVKALLSSVNYESKTLTANLVIEKAEVEGIEFFDAAYVYKEDTDYSLILQGDLPSGVTVSYNPAKVSEPGEYDVVATVSGNENYKGKELRAKLYVNDYSLSDDVEFENQSFVYDGTPKSISVSGLDPSYTIAYKGNEVTDAGEYSVVASISKDGNFVAVLSAIMTIEKAEITETFAFEDASFAYDGDLKSLPVLTDIPSDFSVTYEGNSQRNIGEYEVIAKLDKGNNYKVKELRATLTITRQSIDNLLLEDASFTYDGTAKSLEINGAVPEGATITYVGNDQIGVGEYTVRAVISAGTYTLGKELEAQMTITKGLLPETMTLVSETYVYDGTEKSLVLSENVPEGVDVVFTDNTKIAAGVYDVFATLSGANYEEKVLRGLLTIEKAEIEGVEFLDGAYSYKQGEKYSLYLQGELPKGVTVTYNPAFVEEPGEFPVVATISGNANYKRKQLEAMLYVTDNSLSPDVILENKTFVYDGTPKSITIQNLPDEYEVTYQGNGGVSAGEYAVIATVSKGEERVAVFSAVLSITKAEIDETLTFEGATFEYDGELKSLPEISGLPSGFTVSYKGNAKREVGEHEVVATVSKGDNYKSKELRAILTISKQSLKGVFLYDQEIAYDGTEKSLELVGKLPAGVSVTYVGNNHVDVGEYSVRAVISSGVHTQGATLDATLRITKGTLPSTITLPSANYVYDGSVKSLKLSGELPEGVGVSYENNTNVDAGVYTVQAILKGANYHDKTMEARLVIEKAEISGLQFLDGAYPYKSGEEYSLAVRGNLPVGVTVSYEPAFVTEPGEYPVIATISGGSNYKDRQLEAMLFVNDNSLGSDVVFTNASFVYDGKPKFIEVTNLPSGYTVSYEGDGVSAAGEYSVIAKITKDGELVSVLSAILTIEKAEITEEFVFEGASFAYDGEIKSLAAIADLPLGFTATYEGNSQRNVGEYEVIAHINKGDNYKEKQIRAILTIAKKDLSDIYFYAEEFTYDGSPKSLHIVGELPEGVTVTYVGNDKINVGEYVVRAVITSGAHTKPVTLEAKMTINRAILPSNFTLASKTYAYDGEVKSLVLEGELPEGVGVSYSNNSKIDVGTYQVTATLGGANYESKTLEGILEIGKSEIRDVIFLDAAYAYKQGEEYSLSVQGNLPDGITVTYEPEVVTEPGEYSVIATISGNANYQGKQLQAMLYVNDNSLGSEVVFADQRFVYDSSPKSIKVSGLSDEYVVSYEGNGVIAAGEHAVIARISKDGELIGVLSAVLSIDKAEITEDFVFNGGSYVYDGSLKSLPTISNLPAGVTVVYQGNSRRNVGSYDVIARISKGDNYKEKELRATLEITKKEVEDIFIYDQEFVYDGTVKSLAVAGVLPEGVEVSYEGNAQINVGSYPVVAKLSAGPHTEAKTLNATLIIKKGVLPETISFPSASYTYDGREKSLRVLGDVPEGVKISYEGNGQVNQGSYKVVATLTGYNYTDKVLEADLSIQEGVIRGVRLLDRTFAYNGQKHSLAIEGDLPEGAAVRYIGNGKTEKGNYTVTAVITGGTNYKDLSLTAKILIVSLAGDVNGNGKIDEGEIAGDIDENGIIDKGEISGDITGDRRISNGEIAGDINGNGTIDEVIDYNEGVASRAPATTEVAGDVDGNGIIDHGEIAGDVDGDKRISEDEVTGDQDGNGDINGKEVLGDINGSDVIDGQEVRGDTNGDSIIGGDEVIGGSAPNFGIEFGFNSFDIKSESPSCPGTSSGLITVTNNTEFVFVVSLDNGSQQDLAAKSTVSFTKLKSQKYKLTFTPDIKYNSVAKEYHVVVPSPKMFTAIKQGVDAHTRSVSYVVSGSKEYAVEVNGSKEIITFVDEEEHLIELPLVASKSLVRISPSSDCRGEVHEDWIELTGAIKVRPRVSSEWVYIQGLEGEEVTITLYTREGSRVLRKVEHPQNGKCGVDVSGLPDNIYFMNISSPQEDVTTYIYKK